MDMLQVWHGRRILMGTPVDTPVEKLAKMRSRACVVFPHGTMANSPTKVLAITPQANFGPFTGQLLVGEMNRVKDHADNAGRSRRKITGCLRPFY